MMDPSTAVCNACGAPLVPLPARPEKDMGHGIAWQHDDVWGCPSYLEAVTQDAREVVE